MEKTKTRDKFALTAAILFVAYALLSFLISRRFYGHDFYYLMRDCLIPIAIAAGLFIKNKYVVIIAVGANLVIAVIRHLQARTALADVVFCGVAFVFLALAIISIKIYTKVWFVPGVAFFLYSLIYSNFIFFYILLTIVGGLAFLFAGLWLCPAKERNTTFKTGGEMYRPMATHILLLIFTFGVYSCIWIYKTTKYLNQSPVGEPENPTTKLLLCMFVPFYQIYWFYKQGQKIDGMARVRNLPGNDIATLCLVFGVFFPFVANIIMQDKFNQLAKASPSVIAE